MKTVTPPSRLLQWLVWSGLVLITAGVGFFYVRSRSLPAPAAALPVYGAVTPFSLTNQNGQPITLGQLRGTIWVADIIFTRCPTQCLKMSRQMGELEKELRAEPSVRLVSLTADPAFDTPPILKKYAARFGAADDRWQFLTGDKAAVYGLALDGLKLSVREKAPADQESVDDLFIHSTKFVIVDRQGRLRGWFDGENPQSKPEILSALRALLAEKEK